MKNGSPLYGYENQLKTNRNRLYSFSEIPNPKSEIPNPLCYNPSTIHSGGNKIMAIRLGDEAPDFSAEPTEGNVMFHDWLGDSWGVLFSHPKDYTPVCTTELGMA